MHRYFKLYQAVLKISFLNWIAYRVDAIINTFFTSAIWAFLNVISMYLISHRSGSIFGWTSGELLLISCLYNVFIGIFGFFFSRGFSEFSEIVDTGRLDLVLLKPVDSQFYLSLNNVGVSYLIRTAIGIGIAFYVVNIYSIPISLMGVGLFILTSIVSLILLYSMLFSLNIFTLWAPKLDNINVLFYSLRSLGRYPRETFRQLGEVGFVLLSPFVIILAVPSKMLVGKGTFSDAFELFLLATGAFVITRLFWKFALRHYTSASS